MDHFNSISANLNDEITFTLCKEIYIRATGEERVTVLNGLCGLCGVMVKERPPLGLEGKGFAPPSESSEKEF